MSKIAKYDITSGVDHSYSFATPHRLTVCLPNASDKTILDVSEDKIRMAWSYECLKDLPVAAFAAPLVNWELLLSPKAKGQGATAGRWERMDGYLPALECEYTLPDSMCNLEAVGAATAAILKVTMTNTAATTRRLSFTVASPTILMKGYNPAAVSEKQNNDSLLAGWHTRSDRVLMFAAGADEYLMPNCAAVEMAWDIPAGESRSGWIIRPYERYAADLPALRAMDWKSEFESALVVWRELLACASEIRIPDPSVHNAFLACLADLFVMREEAAEGYLSGMAGTEIYRASNNGEPAIQSICLDQLGYHDEALKGYQISLDQQGENGDWADPQGWAHHWWSSSGFKSWFVREHYLLTRDRGFLEDVFPRMLASTRFQESLRATMRQADGKKHPLNYGLMPQGQGDCGLWDDGNYYGVYLPHNFWAVFGDAVTAEVAEILERPEREEVDGMYKTALRDLRDTLERGAIKEDGYRWIPGVAGKTSGSRWGALNATYPCNILPSDHELITGTIRKLESRIGPGGLPLHLGWMEEGMWVAITLDNLAQTLLLRNDGDAVAKYLYATLNHGTPLNTWCEERGMMAGSEECAGDRQHLFTPIAVVRIVRDSFVMEEGNGLHLLRGVDRNWLMSGEPIGVKYLPTHFGPISFEVKFNEMNSKLIGEIQFPNRNPPAWLTVHLQLGEGLHGTNYTGPANGILQADGTELHFITPTGSVNFEIEVQ